jgi:radical SAM superfamily enzyme YgiQ (UPF0313 family)
LPHVSLVSFAGLRVHEERLLSVGLSLPGLTDRANALAQLPGLGLLTLAGMNPPNWTCSYTDETTNVDALVEAVLAESPDLVAVSALTASIEEAYRFSSRIRVHGALVVLGGLHVTACPEEAQRFADAIVVGEGEAVWTQLLADVERGAPQPRYDAKSGLAPAPWSKPRFDLLKRPPPRYTLQTQRGCPFACEFCGASRLLGSFREKPHELIVEELALIRGMTPRPNLELADDNTFAGDRDPALLFRALADAGARYFTESDWRIGERPEVLRGLAESGCVQVLVGIESAVFRYPGMGKKAVELERMLDAVRAIQEAGVAVNGCFILGADGETNASVDRLIRFLADSPFAELQLTLQTPFPGTRLYDRMKQSGRLIEERGWSHYTLFDVTYHPDQLSVEGLELAFERAAKEIFGQSANDRRNLIRKQVWKNNPRRRAKKG